MQRKSPIPNIEKSCLIIGAAGLDVVGRLSSVDVQDTSNAGTVIISPGGVARNVAENLARLCLPVSLIAPIGQDEIGDQLIRELQDLDIDVSGCVRTVDYSTGIYMAMLSAEGKREHALVERSIMPLVDDKHIKDHEELFADARLVFIDANLSATSIKSILRLSKKYHLPIYADPTSKTLNHRILPILDHLQMIILNHYEAADLCHQPALDADTQYNIHLARTLVDKGVKIAVILMAEFGVCYADSESSGHIPAIETSVTDPTGAGDAFTAGVIYGEATGMDLDESLRLGISAASVTLRCKGSVAHNLTLDKLYANLIV